MDERNSRPSPVWIITHFFLFFQGQPAKLPSLHTTYTTSLTSLAGEPTRQVGDQDVGREVICTWPDRSPSKVGNSSGPTRADRTRPAPTRTDPTREPTTEVSLQSRGQEVTSPGLVAAEQSDENYEAKHTS